MYDLGRTHFSVAGGYFKQMMFYNLSDYIFASIYLCVRTSLAVIYLP